MNVGRSSDEDAALNQSSPLAPSDGSSSALRRTGGWPARSLGWLGVGLGVAGLAVPGHVARLIGFSDRRNTRRTLRLLGARELLTGLAIVSRRRPNRWLWSRVVGDAIDIGLLLGTSTLGRGGRIGRLGRNRRTPLALGALGVVAAADIFTSCRTTLAARAAERENATTPGTPEWEAGTAAGADLVPLRAAITINRPRAEVYAFWRRLENLPRFMTYLGSVRTLDERRSHWTATAGGKVIAEWDGEIVTDVPDLLIGWRSSTKSKAVTHAGRVRFMDAPGNRGTEVHLEMRVSLPGGALAQKAAKIFRKLPEKIAENDLHHLKQLLETGALTLSDASVTMGPHPARPLAPGELKGRTNGAGGRSVSQSASPTLVAGGQP